MKYIYKLFIFSFFLLSTLFTSCGEKSVNQISVFLDGTYDFIEKNNNGSSIPYVYYYNSSPNNIITLKAECYDSQMSKIENKNIVWSVTNSLGENFDIVPSTSLINGSIAMSNGEYLNVFLSNINTLSTYTFCASYDNIKSSISIDVDTKRSFTPYIEIEHSGSGSFKNSINILSPSVIKLIKGHTYKLSLSNGDNPSPYGNLKWIITDDEGTATFNTKIMNNNDVSIRDLFKSNNDIYLNLPKDANKKINIKVKAGDKKEYVFDILTVTPSVDETIDCPTFYTEEIDGGYKVIISVSKNELEKERVCEIESNNSGIWKEVDLENGKYEFDLTPILDKNEPLLFEYKARLRDEENETVGISSNIKLKINPSPLLVKTKEEKFNIPLPPKDISDSEWQNFPQSQLLKTVKFSLDTEKVKLENNYLTKFKNSIFAITDENKMPILDEVNDDDHLIINDKLQVNNISITIPFYNVPLYKHIIASVSPIKGYAKRVPTLEEDMYNISSITTLPLYTRLEFVRPVFEDDTMGYYQIRIYNNKHSAIQNNNWVCVLSINSDTYRTILPSQMSMDGNDYTFTISDIDDKPIPLAFNSTSNKIRTMLIPLNNIENKVTYTPTTGMGDAQYYTTNDVKIVPIPTIEVNDNIQQYANKRIASICFSKEICLSSYSIEYALSNTLMENIDKLTFSEIKPSNGKAEITISEKELYDGYLYIKISNIYNSLDNYYSPYIHIDRVSLDSVPIAIVSNIKDYSSTNYDEGYKLSSWSKSADITYQSDVLLLTETFTSSHSEGHNGGGGSTSSTKISNWNFTNIGTYNLYLGSGSEGIGGRDSGYSNRTNFFIVSRKKGYIDHAYYINSNAQIIESESYSYLKKLPSNFGFKNYTGSALWNI